MGDRIISAVGDKLSYTGFRWSSGDRSSGDSALSYPLNLSLHRRA